jgi:hypothetical protein
MYLDTTAAPTSPQVNRHTDAAAEMVLMLAERTGPDAPPAVRHALAILAGSLGDLGADVVRAGLVGWDSEDGMLAERIAWT